MKRLILAIIMILLLAGAGFLAWLGMTQAGLQWAVQNSTHYLPAGLSLGQVSGRLAGPLELDAVSYQQADGTDLQIASIQLEWNPLSLLTGTLEIDTLDIKTLRLKQAAATSGASDPALPDISLPLQIRVTQLQLDDLSLITSDQTLHIPHVELSASTLFNQLSVNKLIVQGEDYAINSSGDIHLAGRYRHNLRVNWSYKLATQNRLNGQGSLKGNLTSTKFIHHVDGAAEVEVKAQIKNLLQQIEWQAEISAKRFNTQALVADWPDLKGALKLSSSGTLAQARISGEFAGSNTDLGNFSSQFDVTGALDKPVVIQQFSISPTDSTMHVQAQGDWQPGRDGGQLNLDLKWQDLKWPQAGTPWFNSKSGNGKLSGNLASYQFMLQTTRPWPQLPPSQWQAGGQGNLSGLTIDELKIKTLQGEILAQGKLDWDSTVQWDATLQLSGIDPAGQWPDWPGKINANITHSGSYQNGQLSLTNKIVQSSGQLRDYPVALTGMLQWSADSLRLDEMRLHSGQSMLELNGLYGDRLDLKWSVASSSLAELYPDLNGALKAHGLISGSRDQPRLQSVVNASQLRWQDISLGLLSGSVNIDLQQWYQASLKMKATEIEAHGVKLRSLQVEAKDQTIAANLASDLATVDLKLTGVVQDKRWTGKLVRADISSDNYSSWSLHKPAELSLSSDQIELQGLCLANDAQASVCMALTPLGKKYQSDFQIKQIALSSLEPWLKTGVQLDGVANAQGRLILLPDQQVRGHINLSLPGGEVHYPLADSDIENWSYRDGTVAIELGEPGIKITSSLTVNQNDTLQLDALLPQAQLLSLTRDQSIQGKAHLDIRDIKFLASLIPEVHEAKGEIILGLTSKGTIARPGLKGFVNLDHGSFKIPRLGLDIDKLTLEGQSDELDRLDFKLKAQSGKGELFIQGNSILHSINNWVTELKVSGKNFEVSKIPEAVVEVTPDLDVVVKPGVVTINGTMHVPFARLRPRDVSSAVQASSDVVIVGADQPVPQKWSITSRVRLTLDSDHVTFFGYGFEGNIGGSLLLEDNPGQLTLATGEIKVPEGRYRAYGQRLSIVDGKLLFSGGPISNPGLDFRATREINDVVAGLKVGGTLLKPQLEIFSNPAMGQTDALAYLVLGRPMETSSSEDGQLMAQAALAIGLSGGDKIARSLQDQFGLDEMRVESSANGDQASLVVGRYLSSKLYVSYGVGLIESINTFSIRYQLGKKWQLKAESGETQSADLFYTIER